MNCELLFVFVFLFTCFSFPGFITRITGTSLPSKFPFACAHLVSKWLIKKHFNTHGPEATCVAPQKKVIKNKKMWILVKALGITD